MRMFIYLLLIFLCFCFLFYVAIKANNKFVCNDTEPATSFNFKGCKKLNKT